MQRSVIHPDLVTSCDVPDIKSCANSVDPCITLSRLARFMSALRGFSLCTSNQHSCLRRSYLASHHISIPVCFDVSRRRLDNAMRHKTWNAVKIDGPRGTRGQRPPWQKHPIDHQVQVCYKITPTHSKKVLFRQSIKRGSFNWSEWDGSLWETTDLTAHYYSQWFQTITQTSQSFSQQRLAQSSPTKRFWKEYYRATAYAINSMKSLHLFIIENKTVVSVLRSAPARVSDRLNIPLKSFRRSLLGLQQDYNDLYLIQRIKVHRERNAEYFKAETQQYRTMGKAWTGSLNLLHFLRASGGISADHTGKLHVIFDAYPPRWTIEPLKFAVQMAIVQLSSITAMIKPCLGGHRPQLPTTLRHTINAIFATSVILRELLEETAALRYYRLYRFPDSCLEKETELGQRLWQQLRQDRSYDRILTSSKRLDEMSARSKIRMLDGKNTRVRENKQTRKWQISSDLPAKMTRLRDFDHRNIQSKINIQRVVVKTSSNRRNTSGFISWKDWDGQHWNIENFPLYLDSLSVQAAAAAQEEYATIRLRLPRAVPREFDSFLMAHYKSQWKANQSMYAFIRVQASINVLEYMLKTAPPRISQALTAQITQMSIHSYGLASEIEPLRRIRAIIACLPHNPLFFRSGVKEYEANFEADSLVASMKLDMKTGRSKHKAAHGFMYSAREFDAIREDFTNEMQQVASLRASSTAWRDEHPFNVVLPFAAAVNFIAVRHIRVVNDVRMIKDIFLFLFPSSKPAWVKIVEGINRAVQSAVQVSFLNRDLTAIRYYKMQHFPHSSSERVVRIDRAGSRRIMSTMLYKMARNERRARREQKFARDQKAREIVQRKKELKIRKEGNRKARERKTRERQKQGIPGPPQASSRMRRKKQIKMKKRKLREEDLAVQTGFARDMSHVEQKTNNEARERKRKEIQEQGTPKKSKPTASMPKKKRIEMRRVVSERKP
jgi:hypothetical protein